MDYSDRQYERMTKVELVKEIAIYRQRISDLENFALEIESSMHYLREYTEKVRNSNNELTYEISEHKIHEKALREFAHDYTSLCNQLQEALDNVKTLSGLLPICSYCKKIRNDAGYFIAIESYIEQHSDAQFSHTLCLPCLKTYLPHEHTKLEQSGILDEIAIQSRNLS